MICVVIDGAQLECQYGTRPSALVVTSIDTITIYGRRVATIDDCIVGKNINSSGFGHCKKIIDPTTSDGYGVCNPVTLPTSWTQSDEVKLAGIPILASDAKLKCTAQDGTITVSDSSQTSVILDRSGYIIMSGEIIYNKALTDLPVFDKLWVYYPSATNEALWELIGGNINNPNNNVRFYDQNCAIKLSWAFNHAGFTLNGLSNLYGNDNSTYISGAGDFADHLPAILNQQKISVIKSSDYFEIPKGEDNEDRANEDRARLEKFLEGKKGVAYFTGTDEQGNPVGHITLCDEKLCADGNDYLDKWTGISITFFKIQ